MAPGLLLCAAWYYTILAGFYTLYCPVMYIMFLNHKLYRKIVDALFALWELYPVALFQWCSNAELHHYGDYVNPDEMSIIVMNHRTRVDWNYVWIALYHATQSGIECSCKKKIATDTSDNQLLDVGGRSKIKFVLKDELKAVPGMVTTLKSKRNGSLCMGNQYKLTRYFCSGVYYECWIMQLNFFLYVKRNWREDQLSLAQFVDYYKRMRSVCRIVIFPEGTDLSEENKRRSEKFATTNNLLLYEYVLHPRTTGFAALCARLRGAGLAAVYDATVAYDVPAQTEADLLRGTVPKHVYFHFKRWVVLAAVYDATVAYDVPAQTEADLLRGTVPKHVYFHFKRWVVLAAVYDATVAYDVPAQTEADLLRGTVPKHVYFHFKRWVVLAAVYDATVAYDVPAQTEADLLRGTVPKHVYFHFKRWVVLAAVYDATVAYDVPAQTEADLLRGTVPNHVYFHFKRWAVLAAVYDATVAYDVPAQTEADLLRGTVPKHVYFHFKRWAVLAAVYDATVAYDVPAQTEADLLRGTVPKHVYFHFKRWVVSAAVYDATVAYDVPAQTKADLLRGTVPKHVYFHFKRYPIEDLPFEDDALKSWLNDRWREKETSLRKFHKNGQFVDSATKRPPPERPARSLQTAVLGFTFWLAVDALFAYGLLTNVLFRFWALYHSLLFTFVTWYFGGFQNIQYKLSESLKV